MAQFAYNSLLHEVTKITLFKTILGYTPEAYYEPWLQVRNSQYTEVDVNLIKHILKLYSLDI
jgi:hypothetical protein